MRTSHVGILVLLLGPVGVAYLAGFSEAAHYLGLGSLVAVYLGVAARPVAAFSVLVPLIYAAAAVTAQSTGGVAALLVAVAAVVGTASSQGLHRGLIALLAAVLLGSFEPTTGGEVVRRASIMLAGASYGWLLSMTVLGHVRIGVRAVQPQTALGYAVLLAGLVLGAWFAARLAALPHGWWLPFAVAAVSEPLSDGSPSRSLLRLAGTLVTSLVLVMLAEYIQQPEWRGLMLAVLVFAALVAGRAHARVPAALAAPVLVLVAVDPAPLALPLDVPASWLAALAPACAITLLGHWLFWTLRADSGRVTA